MYISELYGVQNTLHEPLDLHLLFYGKQACEPLHSWGPGLRESYIIHFIHSGKGYFKAGEQTYHLTAGQGFLILPGVIVHYEADEEDPWTYSWIDFIGTHAKSFLDMTDLNELHPIFRSVNFSFFDQFHNELRRADQSKGRSFLLQSLLYRFFAELLNSMEQPSVISPSPTKEGYLRAAKEWIEHNYSQAIKVKDIANAVGLNSTYLSSLFQDKYNFSLQGYLLNFRMQRAQTLLQNADLSIGDISRSVGYRDPFLFSKMFKKTIGVSPSEARKRYENN